MAKQTPIVKNNIFIYRSYKYDPPKVVVKLDITSSNDWRYWQKFLKHEKVFRYIYDDQEGSQMSFSARKEQRPSYGRKEKMIPVWIAHKRVGGRLRRVYLGKNENLTQEKLIAAAVKINQGKSV
jgi:neutral trehalase